MPIIVRWSCSERKLTLLAKCTNWRKMTLYSRWERTFWRFATTQKCHKTTWWTTSICFKRGSTISKESSIIIFLWSKITWGRIELQRFGKRSTRRMNKMWKMLNISKKWRPIDPIRVCSQTLNPRKKKKRQRKELWKTNKTSMRLCGKLSKKSFSMTMISNLRINQNAHSFRSSRCLMNLKIIWSKKTKSEKKTGGVSWRCVECKGASLSPTTS